MFRILLVALALVSGWVFAGETPKSAPKPDAIVVARLVEIPGKLPGNELYSYVYVFKYRIMKVELGKVSAKEIYVGQYNPRLSRSQVKDKMDAFVGGNLTEFRAGDVHRLQLVRPLEKIWKDATEDEYFDDDSERWFALTTDKAK